MIRLSPTGKPAAEADIRQLEAQLGVTLPHEFRAFLLSTNAARPESNAFPVGKSGRHGSVQTFLGLGAEVTANLGEKMVAFAGRLPKGVLPIAEAEAGDLICLGIKGGRQGVVYYWDHELEGLGVRKALRPVSKSFGDFLAGLTPFSTEDVDASGVTVTRAWIDPEFLRSLNKDG